jgi:peroxiredoxin
VAVETSRFVVRAILASKHIRKSSVGNYGRATAYRRTRRLRVRCHSDELETPMPTAPQKRYEIGDRIPDVCLPTVGGQGMSRLRGRAQESVVIVFPHEPGCAACRAYVEELTDSGDGFRRWDGRLIVVLPEGPLAGEGALDTRKEVFILQDEHDELWPRIGRGCAAVVVADRWGAIYEVVRDGEGHRLPTPHEVVEWLRYIAIQCPECGVPDTPGLLTWS